jgi:putative SOS response-associated peptidase YedK
MLVKIDGVAYYHYFSSQESGWVYQLAPDKYQVIGTEEIAREVSPTEQVLIHRVVGGEVVPEWGYWTLVPPWVEAPSSLVESAKGYPRLVPPRQTHFNSRKDTLTKSTGWRRLLRDNRCVLIADAFFEWSDSELLAGKPKKAGRYQLTGGRLMPLAAIYSPVKVDGKSVTTVSVVTTDPNEQLVNLPHHRMPAILLGDDLAKWLDPKNVEPEAALHATSDSEIDAEVVPATRYRELVKT